MLLNDHINTTSKKISKRENACKELQEGLTGIFHTLSPYI
jgi:hypothetical protein